MRPSHNARPAAPALEKTEFYRVALECEAAPGIGCGIRAKPLLNRLRGEAGVAGAWLNRQGTVLAVAWRESTGHAQRIGAARITAAAERRALFDSLVSGDEWYAADEVDELSKEEAKVIAARVVCRLGEKTALLPELASRLTRRIADACESVLLTHAPGTARWREDRLRRAILEAGRTQLSERQYRCLDEAVRISPHRPLPHER